ncbi:MAG: carbamoyl-phosphate synthase small subunit [Gammaproteobacteria bacterium]|jgi:carbamoyl-phosphate synthase small subunit|nr:carbamoyl-phosphate synthase small subunit [Gammaproteobacteria bacterium]
MAKKMIPSKLVLSTGEVFEGYSPDWQASTVFGEIVFNTGMVGYVECLSDPSYTGQILTFTYPLIGNYGVPEPSEWESHKLHARGMIVSEAVDFYSREHATSSILDICKAQNVAVMAGVDTRALTKILRERGCVAGAIVTGDELPKAFPNINEQHLVAEVSIKEPVEGGAGDKTVIVVDCGMKENIWRHLQKLPVKLKRVPYNYDYTNEPYDGVFLSNGPGDPMVCQETISVLRKALELKKPIFGICLGSQLMGLAIGAKTYKLRFGHRSQNQPCLQEGTDRCFLTSQNHGFAIDEHTLPEGWKVTFRNLNDNSVQGIEHESLPYFSVQFHPEAAPGPIDTNWLFDKFYKMIKDQ